MPPQHKHTYKACIAHKSGSPREKKWKSGGASPGAHVPLVESNFRRLSRTHNSWDLQLATDKRAKIEEQHMQACPSESTALFCRTMCQKYKSQWLHQVDRITRRRKSAKWDQTPAVYKYIQGAMCGTRAHVDEVMQGRWGLAAAALEHQQQHKRATPRAAPPTECRSTRRAAGAGLNSLRTRPVLPQTSRYYLAESLSPRLLPSRHESFCRPRTDTASLQIAPPPARLIYITAATCVRIRRLRPPPPPHHCMPDAKAPQSLSLIRHISQGEWDRERPNSCALTHKRD